MCFSIEVDRNIKSLAEKYHAVPLNHEFERFNKNKELHSKIFDKLPDKNNRIYPNYFTPVITYQKDRVIMPMRYQLLPHFSDENQYRRMNPKTGRKITVKTFNARIDSLESRHAWKKIFGTKHAVVPFTAFYEYLPGHTGPQLARFSPTKNKVMWAACLWDQWVSPDNEYYINSFAIITDEPTPEVLAAGHDRCPIFIHHDEIDNWLKPEGKAKEELYKILRHTEDEYFKHECLNH